MATARPIARSYFRDGARMTPPTDPLVEALEIAERALATVVEGDPMGVPKNTQCRHGRYTFEGCESCTDAVLDPALEAVRAALASVEPTAAKGD